jgi:selenocysteine-specific elongation factor
LGEYHQQFPLRVGMPREEVKSRLARYLPTLTPRLFNEMLVRAIEEGWLAEPPSGAGGAERIRLTAHQASFSPQQQQKVDLLLYTFRQAPYTTPSVAQCEEMVGHDVLSALIEQGQLVRLNEDVILLAETYEEMQARVVAFLREHSRITVAEVRDLFDTSRKYALALVGYLDEKRITRRVGDDRVLR